MTLDEWAGRVDADLAAIAPDLPAHDANPDLYDRLRGRGVEKITVRDPVWGYERRFVVARVAEDDSSLRAPFVPRDEHDPAIPDAIATHEMTYMRSAAGAAAAARDIAAFLLFDES
jgi:hypothetical protein